MSRKLALCRMAKQGSTTWAAHFVRLGLMIVVVVVIVMTTMTLMMSATVMAMTTMMMVLIIIAVFQEGENDDVVWESQNHVWNKILKKKSKLTHKTYCQKKLQQSTICH